MTTTEQQDVISLLMQDHREVERMFDEINQLKSIATDDAQKRRKDLAEQVVIELVKHSVAEEAEVYPRIREKVDPAEADRLIAEQSEAELTMKALEKLDPSSAEFETSFAKLIQEILAHVQEEEQKALPALRSVCSPEELKTMAGRVESVKRMAPTRPHPTAPDTPPGDKALGPMAGLVDRLRDALSGRGAK